MDGNVAAQQERLAPGRQCRDSCRKRAHTRRARRSSTAAPRTHCRRCTRRRSCCTQARLTACVSAALPALFLLPSVDTHTGASLAGHPHQACLVPRAWAHPHPATGRPGCQVRCCCRFGSVSGFVSSWEGPLPLLLHALHCIVFGIFLFGCVWGTNVAYMRQHLCASGRRSRGGDCPSVLASLAVGARHGSLGVRRAAAGEATRRCFCFCALHSTPPPHFPTAFLPLFLCFFSVPV